MLQICKYNPLSDVEEVVPELSVDVTEIMATHVVAGGDDSSGYTRETDVHEVRRYLRDKISTFMAAKALGESLSQGSVNPSVSQPSGE